MKKTITDKLSTTAMAKLLELPVQQLFATLKDYGWISRIENSWELTSKGEFEGGEYCESKRYGRYIVWPESLQEHPLIAAIEASKRFTTAGLARCFELQPRMVSRAMAELGMQVHTILGWELTDQGQRFGGIQEESENSGSLYVSWPKEIVDDPVIHRELELLCLVDKGLISSDDDLFSSVETEVLISSDGHQLKSILELNVCNWLYLAQLAHAYQRRLPVEETLLADFFLPANSVYIECWQDKLKANQLSTKLKKQEIYRIQKLRVIDINDKDIENLDRVLGGALRDLGIRC